MLKQAEGPSRIQKAIGSVLASLPISPNQWTLLSILSATIAFAFIVAENLMAGLAFFVVAAALDLVDGSVARARGEVTAMGGFLDGIADRFVEAIFLFSFMFVPLPFFVIDSRIWLAALIFIGTCMPSFIRAYADHKGVIRHEDALAMGGLCERSERLTIVIFGVIFGLAISLDLFVYSIVLASILSLFTVAERLIRVIRMAGAHPKV